MIKNNTTYKLGKEIDIWKDALHGGLKGGDIKQ